MSGADKSDGGKKYIPIVSDTHYKVILRPATEYDMVRRTTVFKALGISYVYGIEENVSGYQSEIIEVWFERSKWTASGAMVWMEKYAESLPAPSKTATPPHGEPVTGSGR